VAATLAECSSAFRACCQMIDLSGESRDTVKNLSLM
jgi:hypothetical protein